MASSSIASSLLRRSGLGRSIFSPTSDICRQRCSYSTVPSPLSSPQSIRRVLVPQNFNTSRSSPRFLSNRFASFFTHNSSSSMQGLESHTEHAEETQRRDQDKNIYLKVGPAGGVEGKAWDDGIHTEIQNIFISYTHDCITSIQFSYGPSRDLKLSPKHGGDGSSFQMIELLDNICTVKGTYGLIDGKHRISSIQFLERSGNSYGPYGCKEGKPFSLKAPNGVIGFHGFSDDGYLSAIGIYVDSGAKNTIAE